MAHILETGTTQDKISELLREVEIARRALRSICDAAFISESELMGSEYPQPRGKILSIARGALCEMEDAD